MNIKKAYIILGTSILICAGCSQPAEDSSVVPVLSASLFEIPEPEATEAEIGLNEGESLNREETGKNTEYKDGLTIESSGTGTGTDSSTEEEAVEDEKPDPSTSVDGKFDGGGINLETGEYDAFHDTNNGQGWDKLGQHFDTWGEYLEYSNEQDEKWIESGDSGFATKEELEALRNGEEVTF